MFRLIQNTVKYWEHLKKKKVEEQTTKTPIDSPTPQLRGIGWDAPIKGIPNLTLYGSAVMVKGFSGDPQMSSRDARLSDSCTPDRCNFSSLSAAG